MSTATRTAASFKDAVSNIDHGFSSTLAVIEPMIKFIEDNEPALRSLKNKRLHLMSGTEKSFNSIADCYRMIRLISKRGTVSFSLADRNGVISIKDIDLNNAAMSQHNMEMMKDRLLQSIEKMEAVSGVALGKPVLTPKYVYSCWAKCLSGEAIPLDLRGAVAVMLESRQSISEQVVSTQGEAAVLMVIGIFTALVIDVTIGG